MTDQAERIDEATSGPSGYDAGAAQQRWQEFWENDQTFRAKWISDISVGYTHNKTLSLIIGADNVWDVYPDRNNNDGPIATNPNTGNGGNSNFGIFPYNGISSFGFNGFGPMGLLSSVIGLGLGVLLLILDFDFVERGIAAGLPERESWRAAFGLTVTIIWIYIELLRILAILRGD